MYEVLKCFLLVLLPLADGVVEEVELSIILVVRDEVLLEAAAIVP